MNLIEPTMQNVREEIEQIKNPEVRIWLKCLLTFGARSVEFAGVNCRDEKAYGTIGNGYAWLNEYQPQTIEMSQLAMAMADSTSFDDLRLHLKALMMPIKIAIFKIAIAKKHLFEGEPVMYRWAARPWEKKYNPWVQEIYDYYQERGKELLFPNNRRHYLDYMRMKGVFKKFRYPIERYTLREEQGILSKLYQPAKTH